MPLWSSSCTAGFRPEPRSPAARPQGDRAARPSAAHRGGRRLNTISGADLQQLKYSLREKSPHTVNNVLTVLNTLLKKAIEWQLLDAMPCTIRLLKRPPARTSVFDFEQSDRLVAAAARRSPITWCWCYSRAMLGFGLASSGRWSQLSWVV